VTVERDALVRAVELAYRGPRAGGNPRVGCVIVDQTGILGEGFHQGAGTPHAEAAALAAVPESARHRLTGATAVVTLEPCHHTGRTGPCTLALAEAGISRVIYAVPDPNPTAAGGSAWLQAQGIETLTASAAGLGEDVVAAAQQVSHSWLTAVVRGTPWFIGKTAATLDGRVAAADGTSQWITGEAARAHAHKIRADVDAIVVGTGTVLVDNPALTARHPDGTPAATQPLRVAVGLRDVPADAAIRNGPGTWQHLRTHDLTVVAATLAELGARHVLLEGGPTLFTAALRAGLIDELHAYVAPVFLGGGRSAVGDLGITTISAANRWHTESVERLGDDVLFVARKETECSPD
jgi:diaminohydroxyphosphoribosylaminopyrimidine deaminase/5-amino-6-(5-phosphoribosylamino)uracil reductase